MAAAEEGWCGVPAGGAVRNDPLKTPLRELQATFADIFVQEKGRHLLAVRKKTLGLAPSPLSLPLPQPAYAGDFPSAKGGPRTILPESSWLRHQCGRGIASATLKALLAVGQKCRLSLGASTHDAKPAKRAFGRDPAAGSLVRDTLEQKAPSPPRRDGSGGTETRPLPEV